MALLKNKVRPLCGFAADGYSDFLFTHLRHARSLGQLILGGDLLVEDLALLINSWLEVLRWLLWAPQGGHLGTDLALQILTGSLLCGSLAGRSQSESSLLMTVVVSILFFLLDDRFWHGFLLVGARLGPEIIIKALGTIFKLLCTALVIILATVGEENFDTLVESVEFTLRLKSEIPTVYRFIDRWIPIGLLKLGFINNRRLILY